MQFIPQDFAMSFLSVLFEGLPYIFIGTLISGFIDVYLPSGAMDRFLPKKRWLSILVCGFLGLLIPVCECTVVPVIRRLVAKGLPVGSAFAYMLAAPIVNPITFFSTWTAFESEPILMAFSRLGLGYLVAVTVGMLILFVPIEKILKKAVIEKLNYSGKGHSHSHKDCAHHHHKEETCCSHHPKKEECGHSHDHQKSCGHDHSHEHSECCGHDHKHESSCGHDHSHEHNGSCGHDHKHEDKLVGALRVSVKDFMDVTVYFVIGVMLMILFNTATDHSDGFLAYVSSSENLVQGTMFMMLLSFVLSLCSTSDAFLVGTSFTQFGRVPKMAFLVFGPMMDVKLLFLYQTLMKMKSVILLAILLFVLVGAVTLLWGECIPFLQELIENQLGGEK